MNQVITSVDVDSIADELGILAGMELVQEGENGYILPVGDEIGLKEKLQTIFEGNCLQMGKNSLEIIQDYTIENMAKTHLDVFEKVLKQYE